MTGNGQNIQKSKSVAFEDVEKSSENCSPLKLMKRKSSHGPLVTPQKKRSTSKSYYAMMDEENDASLACSSGKNSRRKLSVVRNAARDIYENNNNFDSHQKLSSQARMCMHAPRKNSERPANARYL